MIDFACADFTFPLVTHNQALKIISILGFKNVDIGLFTNRSHIQPKDQFQNPEKNGSSLKKTTDDLGLSITDIFMQTSLDFSEFAINHPNLEIRKSQREIFKKAIDYAIACEVNHFTGLPGVDFDPDSKLICLDELSWRVEYASNNGITYCVEPHFGSIMQVPETAIEILEDVPGLTIALDHSHYTYQGIEIERLKPLVKYASHLHARGATQGEMQTSVKKNQTRFDVIAEHLREINYSGIICLEYCYLDWASCNNTDNISETLLLRELLAEILNISN